MIERSEILDLEICPMTYAFRTIAAMACLLSFSMAILADEPSPEQIEFFEKQVRPLFAQHCNECHGEKKQEAALRLDSRAAFLKGTDSGPVFVAGNPDGSRLLQVIKYSDGDTQMPPKGKLPDEQIAVIRKWIEMGTPWPAETAAVDTSSAVKNHWAFQPVKRPSIPSEPFAAGLRSPVDSFIAAALAQKQLQMSPPASKYDFIRRATIDLWGVPPTFEQVQDFQLDSSPDAAERLIDRLLASPFYGQRWGRHWLDVARYADSKGYVFTNEPRYPYSYTYRDYVVDALNSDTPFNRFVTEQLAADVLVTDEKGPNAVNESQDRRLAALGFLTVGRRYLNNPNDIIDDRIDVVSRGLLGLTVGCARCHDHKFDPVPTADYYSLYGIFSSSFEPEDLPIIGTPNDAAAYRAFQAELANREAAVLSYENESIPKLAHEIRDVAGDALQQIARQTPQWAAVPVNFKGKNEPRGPVVQRWRDLLNRTAAAPHPVLGPWHLLFKVEKPEEFPAAVNKLVESWTANSEEASRVNPLVRQAITEKKPATLQELGRVYGDLFDDIRRQWDEVLKATPDSTQLPDGAAEQVRLTLYGEGSPTNLTLDEARRAFDRDIGNEITNRKRNVEALKVTSPGAPPRAMILRDGQVNEPVVFIRGNPGRRGKQVPRQFLEIAAGPDRKPFVKGSGRRELAEAIVDPQNPLTSRVITNRIWQNHFGTGLVASTSDFGLRGMTPSHPQLLDWLAAEMAGIDTPTAVNSPNVWSIKRLHRLIMDSAVYQQASSENPIARAADPENRLLWRMPRIRLDLEAMRDSLLTVSGRLDDQIGGQPFDGVMAPQTTRRTIYALVNRNDLPGIFRAFDFADIDASAPERPQTTVPQQSLFAMNSLFIQEQARRLAAQCVAAASNDPDRLQLIYHRVFSRPPTEDERRVALQFLVAAQSTENEKLSPWDRLAQVLLMTNEFFFVD